MAVLLPIIRCGLYSQSKILTTTSKYNTNKTKQTKEYHLLISHIILESNCAQIITFMMLETCYRLHVILTKK